MLKALAVGIIGAIVAGIVGYATGLFNKVADAFAASQTATILSHLEIIHQVGGQNPAGPVGNYIARCPDDTHYLLVGGFCEVEAAGAGVLQNYGIDNKSKAFVCVYQYGINPHAQIFATCLHVKQEPSTSAAVAAPAQR